MNSNITTDNVVTIHVLHEYRCYMNTGVILILLLKDISRLAEEANNNGKSIELV